MTMINPHDASGRSPRGCLVGFAIIGGFIVAAIVALGYWLTHL